MISELCAGARGCVDTFLFGFRPRRRRAGKVTDNAAPREQLLTKFVSEALELDLRAEYPGDPQLICAGRVSRHSSLGGRVFDPAEHRRQEDFHSRAGMRDPARFAEQ